MIGLSGLLVKSAQQMVITAKDLKQAGIHLPILVGGAALTKRFTDKKIAAEYSGAVIYAKDAMNGLTLANQLTNEEERAALLEKIAEEVAKAAGADKGETKQAASPKGAEVLASSVKRDVRLPIPPDFEAHLIQPGPLEEIFQFINPSMLYGNHLGLKGNLERLLKDGDEKAQKLHEQVEAMQKEIIETDLLTAEGIYQYFPCRSRGNDLLIYNPNNRDQVFKTFHLPRQAAGEHLCLSDYCRELDSKEFDSIAVFVVTLGKGVRSLSEKWKEEGSYLRSHMLQAIAVEGAEGMAEWLHKKIRADWGIADPEGMTVREALKNKYQGIRVSFGYPACPDMADQEKLFGLLKGVDKIGVSLTDGHMMDPEASVSALVFHHPEAKYFRADKK